MRRLLPTETEDQIALIEWFDLWAPADLRGRLAAIPNGGWRHPKTAAVLKATGVRPGFPDLVLLTPRGGYAGLMVELKRVRGSKTSTAQKDWLCWLYAQGFAVAICPGFESARDCIKHYLCLDMSSPTIPFCFI